ncbi:MAG: hypothetical protein Q9168_003436 [Polycauliona sp. 1 TL-2023]
MTGEYSWNTSEEVTEKESRGGAIVYRIALWCPELVTHIFTICTPYTPPSKSYTSLQEMVKNGRVPNFGYQLQLASGQLEKAVQSKEHIEQLLNGLYGGLTSDGLSGFDVKTGVHLERLPQLKPTKLMSTRLLDFYADQYAKNGIHGTCKHVFSPRSKLVQSLMDSSKLVQEQGTELRGRA